jgi:hypothetical protein
VFIVVYFVIDSVRELLDTPSYLALASYLDAFLKGRRLHNEELHNLQASLNTIRAINSRRMIWEWHVARIGEMRNA